MIPHGLLADLETWESLGHRCVEIKKTRGEVTIWVFDYSIMEGAYVKSSDDLPTFAKLREQKIQDAKNLIKKLEVEKKDED
jgi:hypothetical protein